MANVLRVLLVLGGAFAAAASATAPQTHTVQRESASSSGFDDTWAAVIDIFAEHNWPIQTSDKASGLIATDWISAGEDIDKIADCGSAPLANDTGSAVRFNIRVRSDGGATSVAITPSFRKQRRFDNNYALVECTSLGKLEAVLHQQIDERARGHAKKAAASTERKVVTGARPSFCTMTDENAGECFLEQQACVDAREKGGGSECAERATVSCFNGTGALDGKRMTICSPSIKDCEAKRGAKASDPDFVKLSERCGIYKAAPGEQGSALAKPDEE